MITAQVAQALGLDAAALEQQAQSAEVTNRIAEDIAAARRFNVIGTPAVFIEGKPIDQIAKGEASFWQGLAEGLSRQNQPAGLCGGSRQNDCRFAWHGHRSTGGCDLGKFPALVRRGLS